MALLADLVKLARPRHWIKNGFVLFPLLFVRPDPLGQALLQAGLAFVAFSLLASAIYCVNDVVDAEADREHPTKQFRPVAARRVPPGVALVWAAVLLIGSAALALVFLGPPFGATLAAYAGNNALYNVLLKRRRIVDIISIAMGFVLRLVAGSVALGVAPSSWMLVCGFSLALFLGFGKRRSELALAESALKFRPTLVFYSTTKIDSLMSISASLTLMSYMLYTVAPETERVHHTTHLVYTVPPVFYGVFRYIFKVQEAKGETPEELILTDWVMQATALIWAASVLFVLRFL
jgi:4-hydroxybenzoate polyprenyltransferase